MLIASFTSPLGRRGLFGKTFHWTILPLIWCFISFDLCASLVAAASGETPEHRASQWQANDPYNYSPERNTQRYALATFYFATKGETWTRSDGWLDYEVDECSWYSRSKQVCNNEGIYVETDLRFNGLSGTLPTQIALLTGLQKFEVGGNSIHGRIPSELGLFSDLTYFNVASNNINGTIPTTLGLLSNVTQLGVHDNQLSGTVPEETSQLTWLEYLKLSDNMLSGKFIMKPFRNV